MTNNFKYFISRGWYSCIDTPNTGLYMYPEFDDTEGGFRIVKLI